MEHSKLSSDNFSRKGDPSLKYSVCEILGEGSYGTVYRGVLVTSRKEFAIKILPFEVDGDNLTNISKEIAILRNLQSPYVVSFHENYLFNNEMWIVMECCHGGSLTDLIEITNFQVIKYHQQKKFLFASFLNDCQPSVIIDTTDSINLFIHCF